MPAAVAALALASGCAPGLSPAEASDLRRRLDEKFQRKVRNDTMELLLRAQKLGVARLRP